VTVTVTCRQLLWFTRRFCCGPACLDCCPFWVCPVS